MVTRSALRQSSSEASDRVAAASSLHVMGGVIGARSPSLSCSVVCASLGVEIREVALRRYLCRWLCSTGTEWAWSFFLLGILQ
eukprot:5183283-Pyramimonas_sp.AAC.1